MKSRVIGMIYIKRDKSEVRRESPGIAGAFLFQVFFAGRARKTNRISRNKTGATTAHTT